MHFETTYRLEDFVLRTRWEDVPAAVRERMKGCFVDLTGALAVGSRTRQFAAGLRLARAVFAPGDIPVVGTQERFGFLGAAAAMGHSSNACDIDDGHNLIRAHPGTSFVGPVLAAACEQDVSRDAFLAAMLVSYETTVRMGTAIMDYYKYAHSSGTFGAVGTAAGVGRLYGFSREQLNCALSAAEFNAPLVPGIRSVEYPSMNKDGVPFGVLTGILAVQETLSGFEAAPHLLEADEYRGLLDDLGTRWQVLELYFKPYPCCRWAHPAIDACLGLMQEHALTAADIARVTIRTFRKATMLSKIVPRSCDEAQYNIAYPVAAALVHGDFGPEQILEENLGDPRVTEMMGRLSFEADEALDAQFPARRICRAEIVTKDGQVFLSGECEPRGEASEGIGVSWLCDKFRRITGSVLTSEGQERVLDMITGERDLPVRRIVDTLNTPSYWKR